MSEQEYTKNFEQSIPRDPSEPQYAESFTIDQEAAIQTFFKTWGFVVLRDAITPEDAEATLSEVHTIIEKATTTWDRENPETWNIWPDGSIPQYASPQKDPIFTPQFLRNRQNEKIYALYKLLLGEEDLLMNHDRCNFFRPVKMNSSWSTKANVHLDMNPWNWLSENSKNRVELESLKYDRLSNFIFENNQPSVADGLQLQAVINLLDNEDIDGGYVTVPRFHLFFDKYFTQLKPNFATPSHSWPPRDWVHRKAQRVPMRAGSVVIWDQRMPHGSFPNKSWRPRSCQMIKMFPAKTVSAERYERRACAVQRQLVPLIQSGALQITEVGRIVFGGRAWTNLPPSAGDIAMKVASVIAGEQPDAQDATPSSTANTGSTDSTSKPNKKKKGRLQ